MKLKLYLITLLTILGSFSASAQSVDTLSNRAGIPQIVSRINKLILSIDSTIIGYINIKIPSVMLSDSGKFLATDGVNSVWRNVPNPDLTPLESGLNDLSNNQVARSWSSDGGIILGKFDRGAMTLTNGSDTVRGHGTSWLTNQDSTWSLGFTYSFSSPSRQDSIMVLWDIIDDSTAILADNYDNWDGPYRWTGPTETIPINVSGNMATGYGSVAFGENAIAVDNFGIAIGSLAKAGSSAVSIGNANQALGPYSLAIGGSDSKVTGWFNTSVGTLNYITGSNSGAFGYQNTVPGQQSYAFGSYNSVQSHLSYVLGTYLISKNLGSFIVGTYNDTTSTAAFAVGTGQATYYPATRKNSFEVFNDGTTKQYKSPWGASYDSLYITTKGYVDTKLAQNPQYWGRSNTSIFPISPTGMDSTIFKIVYNGTARIKTGPWGTDSALVANKGYVDKIVTSLILDTNALHAQKFALINDSLLSVSLRATSTANDLTVHVGTADAHLPSQTGANGKFLQSNGTVSSWQTAITAESDPTVAARIRDSLALYDLLVMRGDTSRLGAILDALYPRSGGGGSIDSTRIVRNDILAPLVSATNVRTDSLRIGVGLNMSKQPTASIVAESGAATNISIALQPKGTGAFYLGPKADSTTVGGTSRGQYAVDLQLGRLATAGYRTRVASGMYSFAAGYNNQAGGLYSVAIGSSNVIATNAENSLAMGFNNNISSYSIALGGHNTTSDRGYAIGESNTVAGTTYGFAAGRSNFVDKWYGVSIGHSNSAKAYYSLAMGYGNISDDTSHTTLGKYNDTTGIHLLTIGNGTGPGDRRNAFEVFKNGTARLQLGPWGTDSNMVTTKGYVDTRINGISTLNLDSLVTPLIRSTNRRLKIESLSSTVVNGDTVFSVSEIGGGSSFVIRTQDASLGRYNHIFSDRNGTQYISFYPNYGNAGSSISSPDGLNFGQGAQTYGQLKVRSTGISISSGHYSDTPDSTLTVYGSLRLKAGGAAVNGKGPNLRVDGKIHGYDSAVINGNVKVSGTVDASNVRTDSLRISTGLNMSKQPTASVVAENSAESNISIALEPKGTGAFYLGPKADGTATGGNARGQGAVDLQTVRSAASQVASGSGSFITGRDNTVSSGLNAAIVGSFNSTISASNTTSAAIIGSHSATMTGTSASSSAIIGGFANSTTTAAASVVLGGFGNNATFGESADGGNQAVLGGRYGKASHQGEVVTGTKIVATAGKAQRSVMGLVDTTGGAVTDTLTLDYSEGSAGRSWWAHNCMTIDSGFVWTYSALISARSDVGDASGWKIEGVIQRVGATTSLVGTPTITTLGATAGATAWAVNAVADDTNDALHILVTGSANKLVRWHATVTMSQVGF